MIKFVLWLHACSVDRSDRCREALRAQRNWAVIGHAAMIWVIGAAGWGICGMLLPFFWAGNFRIKWNSSRGRK